MRYSEFVDVYEALSATTKKLEKIEILAEFLIKIKEHPKWIYLLRGRVLPDYDEREFGISGQLSIKAIARASGVKPEKVVERFKKLGDLGNVAEELVGKKKQGTLFSKNLEVQKVFDNLEKLVSIEGKGAVDKKLNLIVELLTSADGKGAKYIIRTLLNDLRVGVADALLRDAISRAFFAENKEMVLRIEEAYDKANDFAEIFEKAVKGKAELMKIDIMPGRPLKVMLPVKVTDVDEAFRICGKRVAVEHKYDGFRVLINKDSKGRISLFTRKLDNVTKQFPDIVEVVRKYVRGRDFILDSEVVGFDPKTKEYKPFEAISQRIRRKYDIEKLRKVLPVEINVFDIIYYNGKSEIEKSFLGRRKLLERVIKQSAWKIRPATQIITDEKKEVMEFYHEALRIGEEGIMVKRLDAPYRPGRRVGYIVKMKPEVKDLDLVIIGGEYGTGKRAGGLTSFIVACRGENGKFLEVGKVSSGLKEKEGSEGTTYAELNKILQPLIIGETKEYVKIKPKAVVSVTYQNIQPSPRYSSGFALRFPRITHYRPERGKHDIATIEEIKLEFKRGHNNQRGIG